MSIERRYQFKCPRCGERYTVTAPDSYHALLSLEHPSAKAKDVLEIPFDCKNKGCKKPIVLYWWRPKGLFLRT